jgi:hypothetical protein
MPNESSGGVVVLSLSLLKGEFMRNRLFFVVGLIAPALLLTCPVRYNLVSIGRGFIFSLLAELLSAIRCSP